MAYSIDDLENAGTQGNVVKATGVLMGLVGLAMAYSNVTGNQKKQQRIQEIDRQINDYKSSFLGSILYSNEIAQLEAERAKLS